MPGLEVLTCSINTYLNYYPIYSNSMFAAIVKFPLIILRIWEERKVNKSGVSGRVEIQNFLRVLLPWLPLGLCPGPSRDSQCSPDPKLQFNKPTACGKAFFRSFQFHLTHHEHYTGKKWSNNVSLGSYL